MTRKNISNQITNKFIVWLAFLAFLNYTVIIHINLYEFSLGKMPLLYSILMGLNSLIGLLIIFYMIINHKVAKLNMYDTMVMLLMVYIMFVVVSDYYFYGKSETVYRENIAIFIRAFGLYFVGRYFIYKQVFFKFLIVSFLILSLEKVINLDTGLMHIVLGDGSSGGFYLFFGDTFAILSLLLVSVINKSVYKIIMIIFSIFILFIIYSRTSLYLYVIVSFLILLKQFSFKEKLASLLLLLLFISMVVNHIGINELIDNRMINVISTGEDRSLDERSIFFQKGLVSIKESPFIGDYGGQYYSDYSFAHYIHNIISFYRQFGFPVILFFIYIFSRIFRTYFRWYNGKYGKSLDYIFYMGIFIFMEVFMARAYTTLHFWFALGLFSNIKDKRFYND